MRSLPILKLVLFAVPSLFFAQQPTVPPIMGPPGSPAATVVLSSSSATASVNQKLTITSNVPVAFSLTGGLGTLMTVDTQHAIYTAPASVPIASAIGGCGSFPNDSIYNTPVTNLPVHT